IVGYAFGYSLLAFDLMMSLAHKWVSNLFGAFYFMGSFLAALMLLAVLTLALRRRMGLVQLISPKQLHDLGKLCFGFTAFWRYLEIVPSINGGAGPAIGIPELGVTVLFGGLFLMAMGWFGARYPMISPRLAADTLEREAH